MTSNSLPSLNEIADNAAELAELRRSADEVLRQAWSVDAALRLLDSDDAAFDDELWQTVRSLDWPDILVSETQGGPGATLRELVVLAEAAGTFAAPVPLATAAAAAWCLDRCTGGTVLMLTGRATLSPSGVSGVWPVVPFGMIATELLVLAVGGDRVALGVVETSSRGVQLESVTPLDHNPAARIRLDNASLTVVDEGAAAQQRYNDALLRARTAATAELVGIAAAASAAATEYAKVRVAFDRPIGSFQAIKHRLVNQRTTIEVGRALVNRAADACEQDHPDARALVALAAFWGIDSLRAVTESAVQVFGGIAYTWEHEAHLHLRRAACAAASLGPRTDHREVVTAWLRQRVQR